MTLKALGDEMLKYGAYYAINIDGGGGTSMWLNDKGPWCISDTNGGCLVDKPSDGHERATLTAMLVLQGRDVNEPPIGTAADGRTVWSTAFGLSRRRLARTGSSWPDRPRIHRRAAGRARRAGQLPDRLRPYLRVYRTGPAA